MLSEKDIFNFDSFMLPNYWAQSGWTEHVPFMFWLITTIRPGVFVELGTHFGMSYFSVCQTVEKYGLNTKCVAVDTWAGDEHAGFYGEDVFQQVNDFNQAHYAGFSKLLRMTFDEARNHVADHSVDLLHIDGRHFYEDVKYDFESWLGKMSGRGVVLFHDTCVRDQSFGVWRLWQEVRDSYPSFNFHHGNGLGILVIGEDISPALAELCGADESPENATLIRDFFSICGGNLKARYDQKELTELVPKLRFQIKEQHDELFHMKCGNESLRQDVDRLLQVVKGQREALAYARTRPIKLLGSLTKFRLLRVLRSLSPLLSTEMSARLQQAMDERDPTRSLRPMAVAKQERTKTTDRA